MQYDRLTVGDRRARGDEVRFSGPSWGDNPRGIGDDADGFLIQAGYIVVRQDHTRASAIRPVVGSGNPQPGPIAVQNDTPLVVALVTHRVNPVCPSYTIRILFACVAVRSGMEDSSPSPAAGHDSFL